MIAARYAIKWQVYREVELRIENSIQRTWSFPTLTILVVLHRRDRQAAAFRDSTTYESTVGIVLSTAKITLPSVEKNPL